MATVLCKKCKGLPDSKNKKLKKGDTVCLVDGGKYQGRYGYIRKFYGHSGQVKVHVRIHDNTYRVLFVSTADLWKLKDKHNPYGSSKNRCTIYLLPDRDNLVGIMGLIEMSTKMT